jgi:hypothetical protein
LNFITIRKSLFASGSLGITSTGASTTVAMGVHSYFCEDSKASCGCGRWFLDERDYLFSIHETG